MADQQVSCPRQHSGGVVRCGTRKGRQLYRCNDCGLQFRVGKRPVGHRFPVEVVGAAIGMYYRGMSYRQTAASIETEFDISDTKVSTQTIYQWVKRYTEAAVEEMRGRQALIGGHWDGPPLVCAQNRIPHFWKHLGRDRRGHWLCSGGALS